MLLIFAFMGALTVGPRWLVGRALQLHPPLLPRSGSLGRRVVLALSAPLACLLAMWLLGLGANLLGGLPIPSPPQVEGVAPGSPAAQAGLLPGDHILTLDGRPLTSVPQLQGEVSRSAGRPLQLEIERSGVRHTSSVTARLSGAEYRIGVGLKATSRLERGLFLPSLRLALQYPWQLSRELLTAVRQSDPSQRPRVEFAGPVALRRFSERQVSPVHAMLFIVAPWLLLSGVLSLAVSLVLLLVVRPASAVPSGSGAERRTKEAS